MPESLGKKLKKIRESKHLSIEEVSERTRISKKIISAIEEDRLRDIPSAFYARSFVKSYSQFLGVLEEKVVQEYLSGPQKKDTPRLVLDGERVPGDWFIKYKKYIGIFVLAVFSILVVGFSFIQTKKFVKNVSVRYREYIARKQRSRDVAARLAFLKASDGRASSAATKTQKKDSVQLEIASRSNTWIQVTSDGELVFSGILKKGTKDIWKAKKEIKLEVGNAGGITLKLDGKNIGAPGRKGEKKEFVITKDGLAINRE